VGFTCSREEEQRIADNGPRQMPWLTYGTILWYHPQVNSRQRRTLQRVFEMPTRSDIEWKEARSLLVALGADLQEGKGSRVRIRINGRPHVLHFPHPRKEMKKWVVEDLRDILKSVVIEP